jgi:hypothetical protein
MITRDFLTRGGMSQATGAPDVAKARKPKPREDGGDTMADAQAEGRMDALEAERERQGGESAEKYYGRQGVIPGPGTPLQPGQIRAQQFSRPLLADGHAAPSPGHDARNHHPVPAQEGLLGEDVRRPYLSAGHATPSPANVPHVDATGSRAGFARPVFPPATPPGGRR